MKNIQYYQAVCLNGHQKTDRTSVVGTFGFCKECGEKVITNCQHCGAPIEGFYNPEGITVLGGGPEPVPKYCDKCGKPYPWTEKTLEATKDLISLSDLNEEEKTSFNKSIPDLLTDNPSTNVAITKFKILGPKVGKTVKDALRSVLIDVVSETVKKSIFPD